MPRQEIPASVMEQAINDYVSGASIVHVEKTYHVSRLQLQKTLSERGLLRDRSASHSIGSLKANATRRAQIGLPDNEIFQRYQQGESVNSIAKEFNVSRDTIKTRLIAGNIPLRTQTEANQLSMASRTPEENQRNTQAAHKATKGKKLPFEMQCKLAKTRQEILFRVSPAEMLFKEWFEEQGITLIPQTAVGPYNVDLTYGNIAIEIYGGGWHASGTHYERAQERCNYICQQGWNIIIIWAHAWYPMNKAIIDRIQFYAQQFQDTSGQIRVIGGNGVEFSPDMQMYKKALGIQ